MKMRHRLMNAIVVLAVALLHSIDVAVADELRVEMKGHGPCNSDSGLWQTLFYMFILLYFGCERKLSRKEVLVIFK